MERTWPKVLGAVAILVMVAYLRPSPVLASSSSLKLIPDRGKPGSRFEVIYKYVEDPGVGCYFSGPVIFGPLKYDNRGYFTAFGLNNCASSFSTVVPLGPNAAPGPHRVCAEPQLGTIPSPLPPPTCATFTIIGAPTPKPTAKPTPKLTAPPVSPVPASTVARSAPPEPSPSIVVSSLAPSAVAGVGLTSSPTPSGSTSGAPPAPSLTPGLNATPLLVAGGLVLILSGGVGLVVRRRRAKGASP